MLLILTAFAAANATPGQAAPTVEKAEDPVICSRRRATSEVGTHMRPKRICMKKSDWDYQEEHTKRELQQINQRGNNPGLALGRGPDQ